MSNQRNITIRKKPPFYPMGFRCGRTSEIIIVDFLDISPDENQDIGIISSIALTKNTAEELRNQLDSFLENKNE